jgi:hypothetical protein
MREGVDHGDGAIMHIISCVITAMMRSLRVSRLPALSVEPGGYMQDPDDWRRPDKE